MKPLTDDEINDLLTVTLHGPLPAPTMSRVFATLAEVPELRAAATVYTPPLGTLTGELLLEQIDPAEREGWRDRAPCLHCNKSPGDHAPMTARCVHAR